MKTEQLKELQAPLKAKYRETPDAAVITLKADGTLGDGITCRVQTGKALPAAGLHPARGGTSPRACSDDVLAGPAGASPRLRGTSPRARRCPGCALRSPSPPPARCAMHCGAPASPPTTRCTCASPTSRSPSPRTPACG